MALLPDKAVVTIQTTLPLACLVAVVFMLGKFVADVGHIREMMEAQGRIQASQGSDLYDVRDRVAAIESYIGIKRDGQRRHDQ